MSKKNKQMDKHFQIWNMKRHLRCNFIEPDAVDIISGIDSTLHYPENQECMDEYLGISNHEEKVLKYEY